MRTLGPAETGIDFANQLSDSPERNIIEYLYYYNGGGVAVGDINNDGLEDLFFTANEQPDKLYLNKGGLQFEDISAPAGILPDDAWSAGVTMADVNNDGYLDIHVCKVGVGVMPAAHNLLYINQKDGTFKESSKAYGLNIQGFSTQACFLDYDQDGDLDMYLLNHNVHSVRSYGTTKKRKESDPWAGDRFLENRVNEAEGQFVDVTEAVGIYNSPLGYGLAISAADLNGDGYTDIYVGNDFHENDYLYLNNGDKTFREVVKDWTDHTTQFSMGVDIADINNDLLPDIFSTDMLPFDEETYLKSGGEDTDQLKRIKADLGFEEQYARNHLQVNSGQAYFTDLALQTRTFATDWSWGVLLQDFDNNGWKDIFITNGIVKRPNDLDYINYLNSEAVADLDENDPERTRKLIEKLPSEKLQNILFLQQRALEFTTLEDSKVGLPTFSNGVAYADLDQDGYLEVVVNNINEPAHILSISDKDAGGNYLSLQLQDPSQKPILGTKAYVYAGGRAHYQELQVVKGYQSSASYRLHFGLGDADRADSVRIIWPGQATQLLTDVPVNQNLQIGKPAEALPLAATGSVGTPSFEVFPIRHEENPYEDYEKEKLIPERLSQEGPAVLYEDLNADGIKDLLIGGAHGHPMRLLQGQPNGTFSNMEVTAFTRDARYEDADFATIDFDRDGDLDLYVVSGGGAARELEKTLEDRLYLNNGDMDFRRVQLSLPHTNGSVVAVADFNKDGYEDIFVGARSIPGSYGLSPYSFVLTNKEGKGVDIGYKHRFGMVTDAKWADLDQDEDLDLIICGDWMPITVLKNNGQGTLEYLPEEAGIPGLTGFWTKLALADVNQDGQLDIFAGNMGTNSLMQASTEAPIKLYLGDFDDNGYVDPLIFFLYYDRYVPLGSKDKLLSQLPGLKKDFVSYAKFAEVAGFEGLLPEEGQNMLVEEKKVETLQSMLFLSTADGGYEAQPLPAQAQWGTIQDMWWEEEPRQLYYISSNAELMAVHGNSQSARGGVLGGYDTTDSSFKAVQSLNLPTGVQARALLPLGEGQLLLITNNDYPYLLSSR
ncbi:MAG: VCBS repeat-containing protein [Phaeodactylibacter sp.]|uniref:VCBS repeat-containing protein n=1 Tax=Phaeodactylibacter sp. TaxID=1940289 RepID=UPI0032EE878C